jgi:hypothetical protein
MAPKGPVPNKILQYIGVDFGVAARFTPKSRRFFQWIETLKRNHALAEVHGWTRQRPLDGQDNFHGSAYAIPWFSFCTSIHQLKRPVYDP